MFVSILIFELFLSHCLVAISWSRCCLQTQICRDSLPCTVPVVSSKKDARNNWSCFPRSFTRRPHQPQGDVIQSRPFAIKGCFRALAAIKTVFVFVSWTCQNATKKRLGMLSDQALFILASLPKTWPRKRTRSKVHCYNSTPPTTLRAFVAWLVQRIRICWWRHVFVCWRNEIVFVECGLQLKLCLLLPRSVVYFRSVVYESEKNTEYSCRTHSLTWSKRCFTDSYFCDSRIRCVSHKHDAWRHRAETGAWHLDTSRAVTPKIGGRQVSTPAAC